jgi:hypothetical protein
MLSLKAVAPKEPRQEELLLANVAVAAILVDNTLTKWGIINLFSMRRRLGK